VQRSTTPIRCIFNILVLFFISSCSQLNSGTGTVKYTTADAKFNNVRYVNKEKMKNVSFSIKSIQHPDRYHSWAINFRITPSIHLDNNTFITQEKFTNSQGEQEAYPTIYMTRLMGFGNLKIQIHTPLGGLLAAAGFGGSVYRMKDSAGQDTTRTREVRKVDVAYIAFLSRRIFLYIGPRYIRDSYEQYIFAIRVGVFWDKI